MPKDTLKLRVDATPTYWNKENLIGTVLFPIGNIVGAIIGKERMEQEKSEGKTVKEPTIYNIDMLAGAAVGYLLTGVVAVAAGLAGATIGVAGGSTSAGSILGGLGIIGGALATTPISAYIGGTMGKSRMEREYAQAEAQQHEQQHHKQHGRSHTQEPAQEPELEQEVAHEQSNHYTEMVEKQRSKQTELQV